MNAGYREFDDFSSMAGKWNSEWMSSSTVYGAVIVYRVCVLFVHVY